MALDREWVPSRNVIDNSRPVGEAFSRWSDGLDLPTRPSAAEVVTRLGVSMIGRLLCIVGLHKWQQKPDPRGYSGGPTAIYSACWRCEKERRAQYGPLGRSGQDSGSGNPG